MELMKNEEAIKKIKAVVFDVDGTLTDNGMYYSKEGEIMKRFDVKDGMGTVLLRKAGFKTALLTSESSEIVFARSQKLGVDKVILGSHNKTESIKELAEYFKIKLDNIAYIGDDVNDLHALKLVGFPACPSDAVEEIKKVCDFISTYPGGRGAAREFAELILKVNNKSNTLKENW